MQMFCHVGHASKPIPDIVSTKRKKMGQKMPNDRLVNFKQIQASEGTQSQSASSAREGKEAKGVDHPASPVLTPPLRLTGTNGIHWLLKTVCCNHWWKLPDLGRVKWQLVLPKVLRTSVLKHPSDNPPCSRYAPRSGSIRQGIRQGRELRVPLDLLIGHTQDSAWETGQNV